MHELQEIVGNFFQVSSGSVLFLRLDHNFAVKISKISELKEGYSLSERNRFTDRIIIVLDVIALSSIHAAGEMRRGRSRKKDSSSRDNLPISENIFRGERHIPGLSIIFYSTNRIANK